MIRRCCGRRTAKRSAYTLAELAISLPIMGLLAVGMAYTVKIAVATIPDGRGTADSTLVTAKVIDLIASEIAFANAIVTDVNAPAAARQLTFTLPDRDGQAPVTETVSYTWSGIPGDPLLRVFNGTTTAVAASVQEFAMDYEKRPKTVSTNATSTSPEMLLISADGTTSAGTSTIATSTWCGQYFIPFLATNATGWNVTKVQFMARLQGVTTGQTLVQICNASNKLPTTTVLDQQTLLESNLTSVLDLKTFTFVNVPMQSPQQGLCLVLKIGANSPSAVTQYWAGGKMNSNFVSTTNAGSTWTATSANSLRCYIYGTVQTVSSNSSITYSLATVNCRLRLGAAPSTAVSTSIRVHNEPQVTGP